MIEGVENMQILFGEDTAGADTIADTYVDAATVTNWDNVVSVRIALLMRTVEEDFSTELNTNTYDLLGTNFDPVDDHRRRRVFTNTIQIRNRSN
jgi:type IV pilus assembly protein PilW